MCERGIHMEINKNNVTVIKEKTEFIKKNAIKLYYLKSCKGLSTRTVEEGLVGILLSDEPLQECPTYGDVARTIKMFNNSYFASDPQQNYALKVIFSATRYINSALEGDERINSVRDRMRAYTNFIDHRMIGTGEVSVDCDLPKVKALGRKK